LSISFEIRKVSPKVERGKNSWQGRSWIEFRGWPRAAGDLGCEYKVYIINQLEG